MEQVEEAQGAEGEGQHHPGQGHRGGLQAHRHQLIEFALQAREEQQGKQTDLGDGLEAREAIEINLLHLGWGDACQGGQQAKGRCIQCGMGFGGHDQVQARHPNQHPGHQFPQDRGQLDPHHQLRHRPGGHEDHQKLGHGDQGFGHLHPVATAHLKQQRRHVHGPSVVPVTLNRAP